MTTTINASTSSGLVVTPDNSGNVLLQYNGVAAPAFSAYALNTTSLNNGAPTTLKYDAENFDTAGCYNSTGSTVTLNGISVPAYSFAPNVPGYYQINATHYVGYAGGSSNMALLVFKNTTQYLIASGVSGTSNTYMNASVLLYLNGTSDYVYMAMYWTGAGAATGSGIGYQFNGCLLRGA